MPDRLDVVLIGNPESRRVVLFQEALAGLDLPPARLVAWSDLLADRVDLAAVVQEGSVVRIESPGRDFAVEQALLRLGAEPAAEEGDFDRLSPEEVDLLSFEKGRMLCPRQWYLGFQKALHGIACQLENAPPHRRMNAPKEISVMFDKRACHALLAQNGIAVPRSLGTVRTYNDLVARMHETRCFRVFVKIAHGSSASGVVAYQTNGVQHLATTTVEKVRTETGALHLYNSRSLHTYQDAGEIAELIDALCRHNVHVEQWMPKAGYDRKVFDLRVVMIAGEMRQIVVRQSHTPMTNLHLLNTRGDIDAIRARIPTESWASACTTCEETARCFPGSLHIGIDLLFTPDYRRHAVLEVNAFGDLLPGVLNNGQETYTSEILAVRDGKNSNTV